MRGLTNSTLDSAVLNYLIEKNKQGIIDKYGDISDWDVSRVTNMNSLFSDNLLYMFVNPRKAREAWGTIEVKDVENFLENFRKFNQPLNKWDVSNVTDMGKMFSGADSFNQPLNKWNVSNVKNMTLKKIIPTILHSRHPKYRTKERGAAG